MDPDKIVWADDDHTAISSLVWELNGVEHTVSAEDNTESREVTDKYGCIHVYVAPIYQDYYFVNFHAGVIGSDLENSIVTRKLAILGSDGKTDIRIGDITVTSADAQHKIFTGWEGELWDESGSSIALQQMTTLDETGEEYNSGEEKDGFYITLTSEDLNPQKMSVDLYPIFTEVRWFHFKTGRSGNGATYVGDKYLYTSEAGNEGSYFLTDLPVSSRTGYRFKGWFANAEETDSNGDYIDGIQITDENGQAVITLEKKEGRTILSAVSDTQTLVPPTAVVQTAETAPQTGDFSLVFAAGAALSLCGFALVARRKVNE